MLAHGQEMVQEDGVNSVAPRERTALVFFDWIVYSVLMNAGPQIAVVGERDTQVVNFALESIEGHRRLGSEGSTYSARRVDARQVADIAPFRCGQLAGSVEQVAGQIV